MKFGLDCIGLTEYNDKKNRYKLASEIISDSFKNVEIKELDKDLFFEKRKMVKKNMGIILRGSKSLKNEIIIKDFVPYVNTNKIISVESIKVCENSMKSGEQLYDVAYVELSTGLEVKFSLQNVVEYLKNKYKQKMIFKGISLVGLSEKAKVLLPSNVNGESEGVKVEHKFDGFMESEGNQDFELDQMQQLFGSLNNCDIYTVLDTYIVQTKYPTIYNILGKIEKVKKIKNYQTNEYIYMLSLKVMGTDIDVCINKNKLLGIPMEGMRICGLFWLQGSIIF